MAKATSETTWIPYSAIYVASLNGTVVDNEGRRELRYLGNGQFRFTATAENMLFKMKEVSEFQATNNTILPLQYQSSRSNPFKKRTKATGFDWKNGVLHYQDKKRSGTKPLTVGMFDPVSSVYELAKQVKAGKQNIYFKEVNGRKIKDRKFVVKGKETISLPIGKLPTIKLQKIDKKRKTSVWLAPGLNYLAVKVKQVDASGDIYDLELKKYQPKAPIKLPVFQSTTTDVIQQEAILPEEYIK